MFGPRVIGEGREGIRTQCSLHVAEKKYVYTHMLRSTRALPRCISHGAHACTSLEARVHAHRADRTQKSEDSNLFKHSKYGKHAQTERSHRHGHGMEHFFLSFFLGFRRPNLINGLSGWRTPD